MTMSSRCVCAHRRLVTSGTSVLLALCLTSSVAFAETTYLTPPQGEQAEAFRQVAEAGRLQTDIQYIEKTDQDFLVDELPAFDGDSARNVVQGINGFAILVVVSAIALLIFLFLKFGGAGGLLSADPGDGKPRKKTKAWGLTAEDEEIGDIMSKVRAMTNRREALILLLRHCLLQAAHETQTNFRRSDTEREALGRLPKAWRSFPQLEKLLRRSELVHYGGRSIDDDGYGLALAEGEMILKGRA